MGEARYQNVHGRRWGRGARPYLLMAKIVFVAVFVGGLISLLTLVLISPLPATDEGRHLFADALHRAYAWLIVPSLAGAMIIGVALSASFWRAAVRMRWLQVKALLIVVCVPMLHVFMRKRSLTLQSLARTDGTDTQVLVNLRDEILIGTAAALLFAGQGRQYKHDKSRTIISALPAEPDAHTMIVAARNRSPGRRSH